MSQLAPLSLALVLLGTARAADPVPEKIVAYREKEMKAGANHFGMASLIASGAVARPQDALMHSVAMHDLAKTTLDLFPQSTAPDKLKSESKPEIWSDAVGFAEAAKSYEAETAKLVEAAKEATLDNWKVQLDKVGNACGACHDKYRIEDKH